MSNYFDDSNYFIKLFPYAIFKSDADKHAEWDVISGR